MLTLRSRPAAKEDRKGQEPQPRAVNALSSFRARVYGSFMTGGNGVPAGCLTSWLFSFALGMYIMLTHSTSWSRMVCRVGHEKWAQGSARQMASACRIIWVPLDDDRQIHQKHHNGKLFKLSMCLINLKCRLMAFVHTLGHNKNNCLTFQNSQFFVLLNYAIPMPY